MIFPEKKLLLCRPDDYDVRYKINPWMDLERIPTPGRAMQQWQSLFDTLISVGAQVVLVPQTVGQPDMVFTANAGLVKGKRIVLAKFRYKERQGEEAGFLSWSESFGLETLIPQKGSFEGEGDALFATADLLFCGYGFRSDRAVCEEIGNFLSVRTIVPVELIDPRFYHLDTCFAPITSEKALFFPAAFTKEGIRELEKHIELIAVPGEEALRFACNAVVLGNKVVLPADCAQTEKLLQAQGFSTYSVNLDEFLKAGGAAKCLTLFLQ